MLTFSELLNRPNKRRPKHSIRNLNLLIHRHPKEICKMKERGQRSVELDRKRQRNPARRTAPRLRSVASRRDGPPAPAPAARECAAFRNAAASQERVGVEWH